MIWLPDRLKSGFMDVADGWKSIRAGDSNEIECCSVRAVCLAASEHGAARTGADARAAQYLQLRLAVAVCGMSMEGAAD